MSQTLNYTLPEHLQARRAAQRHERTVQIIALIVMVVCFSGALALLGPINRMRKEHQLIINPESLRGLPPDIALLSKLGTFRALAIDWAAMRAERLKEEGKNYEANDLYNIVCSLQPRFPQAWVNAAWNMAYNISVTQYTPQERWKWVNNGIDLLRDKGLYYNSKSVTIYKELAWIYWHKIGDISDDEHRSYRRALAMDIELVLGPPPATTSDEEYYAWFKHIVDAPRDLDRLISEDPVAADLYAQMQARSLSVADTLRLLCKVQHAMRSPAKAALLAAAAEETTDQPVNEEEAFAKRFLSGDDGASPQARFVAAMRSQVLREHMKFDLDRMYRDMEEYGPIDWRSPYSHALYWSDLGNTESKGQLTMNSGDSMNTARLMIQSLSRMVTRGKVVLEPDFDEPFNSYAEETGDTRFIPRLHDLHFEMAREQWGDAAGYDDAPVRIQLMSYWTGFVTDMQNWIQLLYYEGGEKNRRLAEEYFVWLREYNLHPDGTTQERYQTTLEEFMRDNLVLNMQTHRMAGAIIGSQLLQSLKYLSLGEQQLSARSYQLAKLALKYWTQDTTIDPNERRKMQPLEVQYRDAVMAYMQSPQIKPLAKVTLWNGMTLKSQRYAYDDLLPLFVKLCAEQDPPWSSTKAFPEPPGMDAFRKKTLDYVDTPKGRDDIQQGTKGKQ
jgi:hypothetical protein